MIGAICTNFAEEVLVLMIDLGVFRQPGIKDHVCMRSWLDEIGVGTNALPPAKVRA
jgi:hypothetical protein